MSYKRYHVTREVLEHIRKGGSATLDEEPENGEVIELVAPTIHVRDDMNTIICQALDVTRLASGFHCNFRL